LNKKLENPDEQWKKRLLDTEHGQWLVKHRAATQKTSAELYRLLREYEVEIEGMGFTTQALIGVSFSLWRSAFLSDKTGNPEDTYESGVKFMSEMLQNNAIAYSQERNSKDWTFNYYATNARLRLEDLKRKRPEWKIGVVLPAKDTPKTRWEFLQAAFEKAVAGFESHLKAKRAKASA
jgi:hypothetical protein